MRFMWLVCTFDVDGQTPRQHDQKMPGQGRAEQSSREWSSGAWRGHGQPLSMWPLDRHINCPKLEPRGVRWTLATPHFLFLNGILERIKKTQRNFHPKMSFDFKFVALLATVSYQFSTFRVGIEQVNPALNARNETKAKPKTKNRLCVQLHKCRTNKLILLPIK